MYHAIRDTGYFPGDESGAFLLLKKNMLLLSQIWLFFLS